MRTAVYAVALLCAVMSGARADPVQTGSTVVATCGNRSYIAGQLQPNTQDTTGERCSSGTFTDGSTGGNGITQPAGGTGLQGWLSGIYNDLNTMIAAPFQPVTFLSATTGGCTPYHLAGGTAASTNSTLISTGVHTLCSVTAISVSGTLGYLRIYDATAAPTCSSATGAILSIPVPANTSGAGASPGLGPFGVAVTSGLGFCVTGGGTDTDNTNAPTGIYIVASYK